MKWSELLQRRTVRRFDQKEVPEKALRRMLNAARLASCGGNFQHLRYLVIRRPELARLVFNETSYGGHVRPGRTPHWGVDAPQVFIAVVAPANPGTTIIADAGAAVQSMEFAAFDQGLGSCWLGAFDRARVTRLLQLPVDRELLFLLAVGYPAESPVAEDIPAGAPTKYYLDGSDVLHVPKYTVDAITEWR